MSKEYLVRWAHVTCKCEFVPSNLTLTRLHISPGFSGFLCFLRSVMCAFQRTHVCSTDYDIYVTCHLMFHQILVVVADVEPVFNDHSITRSLLTLE